MSPNESSIQSFIIRIWVEERDEQGGPLLWRGHITHVPSEERVYLKDLDDILAFIEPYLGAMGVNVRRA